MALNTDIRITQSQKVGDWILMVFNSLNWHAIYQPLTSAIHSNYSWGMKKVISVEAAKTHLSKLIREVEAGAEVTISRAGKPVIKLVKCADGAPARKLGFAKGQISDFSDSAWEELDAKFNALFES